MSSLQLARHNKELQAMLKPGGTYGEGDEALEFYAKHTAQIEVSCFVSLVVPFKVSFLYFLLFNYEHLNVKMYLNFLYCLSKVTSIISCLCDKTSRVT